ncbi:MAG: hypothetical protein ACK5SX_00410 [Sandaracinobacter sp.]
MKSNELLSEQQAHTTLAFLDRFTDYQNSDRQSVAYAAKASFAKCCVFIGMPDLVSRGFERAQQEGDALAKLIVGHANRENLDLDPILLIEHFKLLRSVGADVPAFGDLAGMVAEHFNQIDDAMSNESRVLRLQRLLADVGMSNPPRTNLAVLKNGDELLLEPSGKITAIVDIAISRGEQPSSEMGALLALLALSEVREYRIDLASHILRFLVSSRYHDEYVQEAVAFIALQRTASGAYGFIDPLREGLPSKAERDAAFSLPVTLSALWLISLVSQTIAQSEKEAA